jgi:hypothetical protein
LLLMVSASTVADRFATLYRLTAFRRPSAIVQQKGTYKERLPMQNDEIKKAAHVALQFCKKHFPTTDAAFLCGSWARGNQHEASDIDLVIIDPAVRGMHFEGVEFMGFLIDACAVSQPSLLTLFQGCAAHRSAPIMHQMLDSIQGTSKN